MTQLRESGEKPGPARDTKDHCCGDPLTPHTHRPQGSAFAGAIGGTRCGCGQWLIPEQTAYVTCMSARGREECSCGWSGLQPGPVPQRELMICLRLQQQYCSISVV